VRKAQEARAKALEEANKKKNRNLSYFAARIKEILGLP